MLNAQESLKLLKEGNARFVSGQEIHSIQNEQRRTELLGGQDPFAIILGCADSRAPAEIVFDRGIGDLFVIRIAGNIVAPSQIGSIEYAASNLNTKLVVVMGHTQCGAIHAALESCKEEAPTLPDSLYSIVERIKPTVKHFWDAHQKISDEIITQATIENVKYSVNRLKNESELIRNLEKAGELMVLGSIYSLETGEVTFFDVS